jgi:galactose oxidase
MFCPGTSLLSNGVLMITGGSSSSETTFFDYRVNKWSVGPKLNIARGYHSHAVLATGEVFTLGGSWSGTAGGNRDGEVWNPTTNMWRTLSNVTSQPLETADREGRYRADNHYWLFLAPNGKVSSNVCKNENDLSSQHDRCF